MMNQEIKQEWVTALRSGDYKQGQTRLRRRADDDMYPNGYCCLGVLCELAVQHEVIPAAELSETRDYYVYDKDGPDAGNGAYLPVRVREWAELGLSAPMVLLPGTSKADLADLNDSGFTFSQIADVIENFA
jgi:hypothetical protein